MIIYIAKNFLLRRGYILSATLFLCLISACKEDGSVVPEFSSSNLSIYDTIIEVSAVTVVGDSVLSGGTSRNLLGKLNDEAYGLSTGEFFTQIDLTSASLTIPDEISFDSIVLYLAYDNFYGFNYDQNVSIHELTEDLSKETDYYSSMTAAAADEILGSSKLSVLESDSFIDSTHVLRIKLNNDLANRIKSEGTFANNDAWIEFFKGIKVTTQDNEDPAAADGAGAIVYFNLLSGKTKMSLFYQDTEGTTSIDFKVESKSARFSHYENNYSTTMTSLFDKEGELYNYVGAMGGVRTKMVFPNIASWSSKTPIAVNKAELIIPFETPEVIQYLPPDRNVVIYRGDDGEFILPSDFFTGGSEYFGGKLDLVNLQYSFNLASTMHDIINNGNYDREMFLSISGNAVTANRLKINSGDHQERKIYLILSYTKTR